MTSDRLEELLRTLARAEREAAAGTPAGSRVVRTPDCVPLSRAAAGADALTPAERGHVAGCAYCAAAVGRAPADGPPADGWKGVWAVRPAAPARDPDLPRAIALSAGGPRPGPATVVLALAEDPAADPPGVALPPELVARLFSETAITHVAVELIAAEAEPGSWVPAVRVMPGPDLGPLTVVVAFPGGEARTFVVPANPPGSLRVAESAPAAPVPAVAVEPGPGGWRGELKLS